jgi:hypothetical protein
MILPSPDTDDARRDDPIRATRRQVLANVGAVSSVAVLPSLAASSEPQPEMRGEPFDDGTYFDDGFGWID